ncbi:MAG: hypothetical protein HC880_03210 [Bacteroidia bacterium]|nr:hypothetical protein [Bacteroidia bacterium]
MTQSPLQRYDEILSVIDSEEKAYLLGWVAGAAQVEDHAFKVKTGVSDLSALPSPWPFLYQDILGEAWDGAEILLPLRGGELLKAVRQHLGSIPGEAPIEFPQLHAPFLQWSFLRAYYESRGQLNAPGQATELACLLEADSEMFLQALQDFCGIPGHIDQNADTYQITWLGNNGLDFLARLYHQAQFYQTSRRDLYRQWATWIPPVGLPLTFQWARTLPEAVPPFKERASDSGYDLSLVRKVRQLGRVDFYDTGIQVQPTYGWYFDLVPRSSLSKPVTCWPTV